MDKVSVVIPTYNRQNTLSRAVKSVLQQTYPVHEILICDDDSDDDSKKIISEFKSEKIKWLDCGKNGMPSIPRNKGIEKSTGDWIAFLDSDDEWLPTKIEVQLKELKENNSEASSSNAFRIVNEKNEGTYLFYNNPKITFQNLLAVNYNICSSVIVSKKLIEKTSLFPEEKKYKAIEDYALWLRVSTKTDFVYVSQPLLNYYDNPQQSIRANETDEWQRKELIFSDFILWLEQKNIRLTSSQQKEFNSAFKYVKKKGNFTLLEKIKRKLNFN